MRRLSGYEGRERPERAQVIVRRQQIGPVSDDIGFVRKQERTFGAVLSEYDRRIGFDDKWLGRLHQVYKESSCWRTPGPGALRGKRCSKRSSP